MVSPPPAKPSHHCYTLELDIFKNPLSKHVFLFLTFLLQYLLEIDNILQTLLQLIWHWMIWPFLTSFLSVFLCTVCVCTYFLPFFSSPHLKHEDAHGWAPAHPHPHPLTHTCAHTNIRPPSAPGLFLLTLPASARPEFLVENFSDPLHMKAEIVDFPIRARDTLF